MIKLFEQFINQKSIEKSVITKATDRKLHDANESFDSYYFHKSVFDGHKFPNKEETYYAVIAHNRVEVNGTKVSLKVEGDNSIGAAFKPQVLSMFDNEADAKVEYDKALKAGGTGANLSFSYGSVISKGANAPYTQIEGYTATGKVK